MNTKDQAIARFVEAVKQDRHDWEDWPTDSREAFIALQTAAPTSADYAMGYAEGFNDACKPPAQPATPEDMVIYKAIADNYQNSLKPPAPDCRTCTQLDGHCWSNLPCTNGDQYQPAPSVVLWRTEP